ncbi:MAG: hypothetical protein HYT80_11080 [Euryarchaeota archaeon]|nr:hypothetical protein [Euryarchaeota archaeon]
MRGPALVAAALLAAGCSGSPEAGGGPGNYKSQYLDVTLDETADKVTVDDVRMERTWNYIQVKATKATLHVAVNAKASRTTHVAVLSTSNQFVILGSPESNVKRADYMSFCGMSGANAASVASVSLTIGDSGSNEDLVTVAFASVNACT